jgi:hypothetical protein
MTCSDEIIKGCKAPMHGKVLSSLYVTSEHGMRFVFFFLLMERGVKRSLSLIFQKNEKTAGSNVN